VLAMAGLGVSVLGASGIALLLAYHVHFVANLRSFEDGQQLAKQQLSHFQDSVSQLTAAILRPGSSVAEVDAGKLVYPAAALEFALVSDLDKASRNARKFSWHSFYRRGVLRAAPEGSRARYTIEWLGTDKLETMISVKNRSMELSDLVMYDGKLFAMCDITGLVFEVDPVKRLAFQRLALPDGNGKVLKPFKSEWATVKDGILLVGSMGREWVGDQGQIEHFDSQWLKSIDKNGRVESLNWRPVYE
ncbi:unnamed protein product, partial [Polarella glacialis]